MSINVLKMEFVENDTAGEYDVAEHLLESDGAPAVVLDEIPETHSDTSSVVVSGYVIDPVADITEGSSGNITHLAFRRFYAARVAVLKSSATAPAIRREPLRRGPEEKMVSATASSRTAASFAEKGFEPT